MAKTQFLCRHSIRKHCISYTMLVIENKGKKQSKSSAVRTRFNLNKPMKTIDLADLERRAQLSPYSSPWLLLSYFIIICFQCISRKFKGNWNNQSFSIFLVYIVYIMLKRKLFKDTYLININILNSC